jgi:hypothetical protein
MIARVLIVIGVVTATLGAPSRSSPEPPLPRDLDEVVSWSDVIVVGTLREVVQESRNGIDYAEGRIHVAEVLWGPIIPENRLVLQWSNPTDVGCPRTEHAHHTNERGIWLLETLQDGTVGACDPECFQPENRRDAIRTLLNVNTLRVRVVPNIVGWPWLNIRIRNGTSDMLVVPGLGKDELVLVLDPSIELDVFAAVGGQGERLTPLPGRLRRDPSISPIAVPPKQDHTFRVLLTNTYALKPSHWYSFSLSIPRVTPRVVKDFHTSDCLPKGMTSNHQ